MNATSQSGQFLPAEDQNQFGSMRKGVSIVRINPDSVAQRAGLQKGDVIVEYDGVGNLTTETLPALTTKPRPAGTKISVVFLRDGRKYSLMLPPGPLGISGTDATMHGDLRDPQGDLEITSSVEGLVKFIKAGLSQGTTKASFRKTLVRNGWDKREAAVFVDQVADEMKRDPNHVRAAYEVCQIAIVLVLLLTMRWIPIVFVSSGKNAAIKDGILWGVLLTGAIIGWLVWRKRLKSIAPKTREGESRAILFVPTKGDLQIKKVCRSWTEAPLRILDILSYMYFGLLIILLVIALVALSVIVFQHLVAG